MFVQYVDHDSSICRQSRKNCITLYCSIIYIFV